MGIADFKYYKWNDYVFRRDIRTGEFYTLTKCGNWVMSDWNDIYYDAGSDDVEIAYEEIDNPIRFKKEEDIITYDYDGKIIIDENA